MSRKYHMGSAQKRLFAIEQMQDIQHAYHVPLLFSVEGKIDEKAMEYGLQKLHERHELLRTSFEHIKDTFVQAVHETVSVDYVYETKPVQDIQEVLKTFIQPFDLAVAPLMRTKVIFDEAANRSYLMIDIHHIIYDGGSYHVLVGDLVSLYHQLALPKQKIQFKDFIAWQKKQKLVDQEAYWREEFSGETPTLALQTDFPRQRQQSFEGDFVRLNLDKETIGHIRSFAQAQGISEYVVMMAAFMILLSKYSHQQEIVVGTPVAGRTLGSTQNLLGMFVNTLAIKGTLGKEDTFSQFVQQIAMKSFRGIENQDYPFEDLVEYVLDHKDSSRNPLFDVLFAYQKQERIPFQLDGKPLEQIPYDNPTSKFDISATVIEEFDGLQVEWNYKTTLFHTETIQQIAAHYQQLLKNLLAFPNKSITAIDMLDDARRQQLLQGFTSQEAEHSLHFPQTIVYAFEEMVAKYPKKIALRYGHEEMDYVMLNQRANGVAEKLREMGVQPDTIVGLLAKPSLEMFIGMLGILKSGAAYLPLDPTLPKERLTYMIADSGIRFVVQDGYVSDELLASYDVLKIKVTEQVAKSENLEHVTKPEHLAYLIYTSGTTGQPKGVMVEQQSVMNLVQFKCDFGDYDETTTILQHFNYAFDGSVWEIFPAILSGCTLEIMPESTRKEPQAFLDRVADKHLTVTPSLFKTLLDYAEASGQVEKIQQIKRLYLAAEPLSKEMLEKYREICGGTLQHVANCYGPTEGTVCCVAYRYQEDIPEVANIIGEPIQNMRIYVLNGEALCDVGVPGELCFAGVGVARGYLNQVELTKEKFVQNPFVPNQVLYRTGDMARWNESGNLEYLGRIDEQVKIRGFRVELKEIEEKIRAQAAVTDVVCVKKVNKGSEFLCAYVLGTEVIDTDQVKEKLQQFLPDYMIPNFVMQLEAFPTTRNGKIDKRALPSPQYQRSVAITPPRDEQDEIMLEVFRNILNVEEIGIDDDFFMLGGDSIKAIRIVSKFREKGYSTDVKSIMQCKTIRGIRYQLQSQDEQDYLQEDVTGTFALTPIQSAFVRSQMVNPHHFNQGFMLESKEKIQSSVIKDTLNQLVRHHDILRGKYQQGTLVVPAFEQDKHYELLIYDFDNENSQIFTKELLEEKVNDIQKSMCLDGDSLVKVAIFHTEETDYLFFCIHHFIIDGVSWRILLDDVNNLYAQGIAQQDMQLPRKMTSFMEWGQKLEEYAQTSKMKKEIVYWQDLEHQMVSQQLVNQTHETTYQQGTDKLIFPTSLTQDLLYKSNQVYPVEISDVLLTAVVRALKELFGKDTFAIQMEGHGREKINDQVAIDRTIGWFTTTYPIVLSDIGNEIRTDLGRVRNTLKQVPQNGIGYGILSHYTQALHGYEPDVTFNFLGQFSNEGASGAFQISNMPVGEEIDIRNQFGSPLSINGVIVNDQLELMMLFNQQVFSNETIQQLKEVIQQQLAAIIAHCKAQALYTTSYGELEWSDEELATLNKTMEQQDRTIEKIYPLTPMQEGILYHYQTGEHLTGYVVQCHYAATDKVDVQILEKSLHYLAKKHEALRSNVMYNGFQVPRQVVQTGQKIAFSVVQLASNEQLEAFKKADVVQGFDLEKDSLMRVTLVRGAVESEPDALLFTFHHIMMDGWCLSILLRDLLDLYQTLSQGIAPLKIDPVTTYEQYVYKLLDKDMEQGLDYWENLLDDYEGKSEILPLTKRAADTRSSVERNIYCLSKEHTKLLDTLGKRHGITMNTFVEVAWGILLQKYNYQSDAVFGKIVSGRNASLTGIEEMIGLFINMIPVRVQTQSEMTVIDLLQAQQQQALASGNYDYCPLSEIQKHTTQQQELIQTMIAFENYHEESLEEVEHLKLQFVAAREETHYPISLSVYQTTQIQFTLMYDSTRYTAVEMDNMMTCFLEILEQIAKQPQIPVAKLRSELSQAQQILLEQLNDTTTDYLKTADLMTLFEAQVAQSAEQTAVIDAHQVLTYQELNQQANKLAQALIAAGISAGDVVGIIATKDIQTIVMILGVLKVGGTYLPIDNKYPEKRIQYILEDAEAKLLLIREQIPMHANISVPVLPIAEALQHIEVSPVVGNTTTLTAASPAYIMYTSGTTGKPKGVVIHHQNVIRLVQSTNYCDFTNIRILQTGSLAFDAATFEIWGALLNGGCLYMAEDELLGNPERLKAVVQQYQLTTAFITTALFNSLVDVDATVFSSFREILTGGERASELHMEHFGKYAPDTKLIHVYGPTENTTFTTYHVVGQKGIRALTPIGKPIANSRVYILDTFNQPCGVGMIGEICIAGDGLSSGYLKRPNLNKEKFFKHPTLFNERLYRSGDLGRINQYGEIEYIRRVDEQLKIRGFRIELGEIIAQIRQLQHVQDATVLPISQQGENSLCAYVVTSQLVGIETLKAQLRMVLPDYMIPTYWICLDKMPLNHNGKLDKHQLPQPEMQRTTQLVVPRNQTETIILNTFKDILNRHQIGIEDHFFALGGHSLKATRLVNQLEKHFGVRLPLKRISELNSVAAIAEEIDRLSNVQQSLERIPVIHHENNCYSLSSAQRRLFVMQEMFLNSISYNIPSIFEINGEIDVSRLEAAFKQLIARHEPLRTVFVYDGDEPVQKILPEVAFSLERLTGKEEEVQTIFDAFVRPFNLGEAPLMRGAIVQLDNRQMLFVDMHHIISDGGTNNIWIKDLIALYHNEPLEPLTSHYKDFSEWQNKRDMTTQKSYWLDMFSDEIPVLEMRTDSPRPKVLSNQGSSIFQEMSPENRAALQAYCTQTETTEYMVLLTTFMLLLSKYSRQEDIVVGTPISGRVHADTEDMFGMFVNTLPIRGDLSGDLTFQMLLQQIKEKCLSAYEHQEYPFEALVQDLEISRDPSRNPLFNVMFALQNNETQKFTLGEATLQDYTFDTSISKFDITLSMSETQGGYQLYWEYATDLFKETTIRRMGEHFLTLLEHVLAQPMQLLSKFEMVSELEKAQLKQAFLENAQPYPKDSTLIELFEEQAARVPNRIAIQFQEETLTYQELNEKANVIGKHLREKGVQPDQIVGLYAQKSLDMLVGMLGILKSGGAYLPIDPKHPIERVRYMLEDCQAAIVVGDSNLQNLGTALSTYDLLDVSQMTTGKEANLPIVSKPNHLAYIIYTSGTTGKPKGVLVENHGVVNLCAWLHNFGEIGEQTTMLQQFNYIFDGSVFEIFPVLLAGGRLNVLSEDQSKQPEAILEKMAGSQVIITPSMFSVLVDYAQTFHKYQELSAFEKLYLGGEAVPTDLIEKYCALPFSDISRVYNCYGPTEISVCATSLRYTGNDDLYDGAIGKPIANTRIVILNGDALCGIGVPGEICIAGTGVTRGYLNRSDLTSEKFIYHPFVDEVVYRTGDLAYLREDGVVMFMGRIDQQVKIRGFRIETQEIAAVIRKIPGVKDVTVHVCEKETKDKGLCAYLIADEMVTESLIKHHLANVLPEYMIPEAIIFMDIFPLSKTGKLDKKQLPTPVFRTDKTYVAPQNEVERTLTIIIADILGLPKVGAEDDFFELGGHSLNATKLSYRIEKEFGLKIPLVEIFTHKTARKIGELLMTTEHQETTYEALPTDLEEEVIDI